MNYHMNFEPYVRVPCSLFWGDENKIKYYRQIYDKHGMKGTPHTVSFIITMRVLVSFIIELSWLFLLCIIIVSVDGLCIAITRMICAWCKTIEEDDIVFKSLKSSLMHVQNILNCEILIFFNSLYSTFYFKYIIRVLQSC